VAFTTLVNALLVAIAALIPGETLGTAIVMCRAPPAETPDGRPASV
jgi:hypothetical protein